MYIFFYRFGYWLSSTFTPTGRLLQYLTIFAAVFGIDTHNTSTYQLFALCASLLLVSLISRLLLKKNDIQALRLLPDYFIANQNNLYSLQIKCASPLESVTVTDILSCHFPKRFLWSYRHWRKTLVEHRNGIIGRESYPEITSNQIVDLNCFPLHRGLIHFEQSLIGVADPLNLSYLIGKTNNPQSCLVLPKYYPLSFQIISPYLSSNGDAFTKKRRSMLQQESLSHLRDYRRGDALNKVHWRSVAKQGRLIVHDSEPKPQQENRHAIILDSFLESGFSTHLEEALAFTHSLMNAYTQKHHDCDLCAFEQSLLVNTIAASYPHLAMASAQPVEQFSLFTHALDKHLLNYQHLIFIFLDYDHKRQQWIQTLKNKGLSLSVFVIYHENKPLDNAVIALNCLTMPDDLAKL